VRLVWTARNISHIAQHGVSRETVEAIFHAADLGQALTEREDRWIAEGTVGANLYRVVYALTGADEAYPITAHRISKRKT
jgi:uncharacterized DUF497 family protein